jgi:hypothetical protein
MHITVVILSQSPPSILGVTNDSSFLADLSVESPGTGDSLKEILPPSYIIEKLDV